MEKQEPIKNPIGGGQVRDQVQYALETNDELKINIVLDLLSYFNQRELVIIQNLIKLRQQALKEYEEEFREWN